MSNEANNENLPDVWRNISLKYLEDKKMLTMKNGFPCGNNNEEGRGFPQLRPMNVDSSGEIDLSLVKFIEPNRNISDYYLKSEDVIFNNTNSSELVGKTALWTGDEETYVLSNHMTFLRFSENSEAISPFISRFLHWQWSKEYFKKIRRQHVNQASISIQRLREVEIELPPLSEQKAIAKVLRSVQEAKEARQNELNLERERKNTLMDYLFTHGTRGESLKQTEIGEMPESWKIKELKEVTDIVYGVQAAVAHLKDKSIGIPILTNINITNEGKLDFETLRYYELPQKKRETLLLQKGDLLFNWRSGSKDHVGKTAIFDIDGEFTFSSFILRLRPNEKIENNFLLYYLYLIKSRGFFSQNRRQSSINSVFNASVASLTPVALPKIEEQKEITEVLQACDEKISALEKEINLHDEFFKAMLEELMSGKLSTLSLME